MGPAMERIPADGISASPAAWAGYSRMKRVLASTLRGPRAPSLRLSLGTGDLTPYSGWRRLYGALRENL